MRDPTETKRKRFTVAGMKMAAWRIAQSHAAQSTGAGCGGICFSLQLLFCAVLILGYNEIRKKPNKSAYFLHSSAPFHAVRIPFNLRDGKIMLPGELSGKKLECEFDTGCPEIIWDASLHLTGKPTGQSIRGTDMTGNASRLTEVVLPSVRFGDYEVQNHPTKTLNLKAISYSMLDKAVRQAPLIGNEVFRNVVVTVDYRVKELIIPSPDYDFTQQPLEKGAEILPFYRASPDTEHVYGIAIVHGTINDVPARIMPDTGCLVAVWMDNSFVTKIEHHTRQTMKPISTPATDLAGNPLKVYRAQIKLGKRSKTISNAQVVVHPKVKGQEYVDAIVGNRVLQSFRMTVDYPRQKILLEPYSSL